MQQTKNMLSSAKNMTTNAYQGTKNLAQTGLNKTGNLAQNLAHGTTNTLKSGTQAVTNLGTNSYMTTNNSGLNAPTTTNMVQNTMTNTQGLGTTYGQTYNNQVHNNNLLNNQNHGPVIEHKEVTTTKTVVNNLNNNVSNPGYNYNHLNTQYNTSSNLNTVQPGTTNTYNTTTYGNTYQPNVNTTGQLHTNNTSNNLYNSGTYTKPLNSSNLMTTNNVTNYTTGQTQNLVNTTTNKLNTQYNKDHYMYKPVTTTVTDHHTTHTNGLVHHTDHHTTHTKDLVHHTEHHKDHHLVHHLDPKQKLKYVGVRNLVSNQPITLTNVDTPHTLMNDDFNHHQFFNSTNVNARPVETVTTTQVTENIIEKPLTTTNTHTGKEIYHVNQLPNSAQKTNVVNTVTNTNYTDVPLKNSVVQNTTNTNYTDLPLKTPVKQEVDYFDVDPTPIVQIEKPVVHYMTDKGCTTQPQNTLANNTTTQTHNYTRTSGYKPVTKKYTPGTSNMNNTYTTTQRVSSNYKTQPLHLGDSNVNRQSLYKSNDSSWQQYKQPSQSYKKTQLVTSKVYKNPTTSYTRGQHYTTVGSNRQVLHTSNHSNHLRNSTSNINRDLYTSQAYHEPLTSSSRKVVTTQTTKRLTSDQFQRLNSSNIHNPVLENTSSRLESSYFKKYAPQTLHN